MSDLETHKVAREVAEQEFHRFAEMMALDIDKDGMDDEDRASFDQARRTFVSAVMAGSLVVNDEGEPVFTPVVSEGGPLTFHEPEGAHVQATDKQRAGHDISKLHVFLAGITKTSPQRFAKMKRRDLKVCHAVGGLFLGG